MKIERKEGRKEGKNADAGGDYEIDDSERRRR
jgi:hypothetical protein